MTLNPFIEMARHPVATTAWLGYLGLMGTVLLAAVPWSVRTLVNLRVRYVKNRHSDRWYALDDANRYVIPPPEWWLRLVAVGVVLSIAWWALGSIVWLLGA